MDFKPYPVTTRRLRTHVPKIVHSNLHVGIDIDFSGRHIGATPQCVVHDTQGQTKDRSVTLTLKVPLH